MAQHHRRELADEAQELWPLFERLREATTLEARATLPLRRGVGRSWRFASLLVAAAIVAAALFFWFPSGDRVLLAEVTGFDGPVMHELPSTKEGVVGCCSSVSEPLRVGCKLRPGTILSCGPQGQGRVRLRSGCMLELTQGSVVRFDLNGQGLPVWTVQSGGLHYECGVRECRILAQGTELRAERSANVRVAAVANGVVDLEVLGGPVCVLRRTQGGESWDKCAPGLNCCFGTPATRSWLPGK